MISQDIRNTVGVVARQVEAETLTEETLLRALKMLLASADEVETLEAQPVPEAQRKVRVTPLSPGIPACAMRRNDAGKKGELVVPAADFWKRGRS
jgi:hypothetical protein